MFSDMGYKKVTSGELAFAKNNSIFSFVIHSDVFYLNKPQTDKLWEDAAKTSYNGTELTILGPEDTIISVIAHTVVHHGAVRNTWINDVSYILKHYKHDINWQSLISKIREYNLKIPAYILFSKHIPKDLLIIPNEIITLLKPSSLVEYAIYYIANILVSDREVSDRGHILRPLFVKNKMQFLFRQIFPSKDFLKMRYPKPYSNYPVILVVTRPFILFFKGITVTSNAIFSASLRARRAWQSRN